MAKFSFVKPVTETELQDRIYQEVMEMLAHYIAEGATPEDQNRRGLVIKRRCMAQAYSQNYDALRDFAAEIARGAEWYVIL